MFGTDESRNELSVLTQGRVADVITITQTCTTLLTNKLHVMLNNRLGLRKHGGGLPDTGDFEIAAFFCKIYRADRGVLRVLQKVTVHSLAEFEV